MKLWKNPKFWMWFIILLIPLQFIMALPGAIFIHQDTSAFIAFSILATEQIIGWLVPLIIARRIALKNVRQPHGFPVILNPKQPPPESAES